MFKNKSYIGISFVILIFGIYAVPKIIDRLQNNEVVKGDRLDKVNATSKEDGKLVKIGPGSIQTLVGIMRITILIGLLMFSEVRKIDFEDPYSSGAAVLTLFALRMLVGAAEAPSFPGNSRLTDRKSVV